MRVIFLVVTALALSAPAWATISNCTAPPGTLLGNYLPTSATNGCDITSENLRFSNFSIGTTTGTINGIALTPTTAGEVQPDGTNVFLSAPGAGVEWTSTAASGTTCKSNTNDNGFCVQGSNASLVSSISYSLTALNATSITQISATATMVSHSSGQGGASVFFFREFCPGAATFTQGCANYGVIQIGQVVGQFQTVTGSGSAALSGYGTVAIRDTVFLTTAGASGSFATLESSDFDAIAITPEPATYGMVGLALAGLGLLKFRRKRN